LSAQTASSTQNADEIEDMFAVNRRAARLSFAELRQTAPCRTLAGVETYPVFAQEEIDAMLKVAKVTAADRIFDLTYGNGLLATAAATQFGARVAVLPICARGLKEARTSAASAAVGNRITVLDEDLFTTNLANTTVVMLSLLPALNDKLFPKLMRELKPGTRVVSRAFDITGWEPGLTLYEVGPRKTAVFMWTVGSPSALAPPTSSNKPVSPSSGLATPRIHTMTNQAFLGTFPRSPAERDLVTRQLNVLIANKQQILECNYGTEATGFVSFEFWYRTAPAGIHEMLRTLPGNSHPFWLLGVDGLQSCPATRELARDARRNGLLSR
jgi:hypothetical protein